MYKIVHVDTSLLIIISRIRRFLGPSRYESVIISKDPDPVNNKQKSEEKL
jgi:hypothetical protein